MIGRIGGDRDAIALALGRHAHLQRLQLSA
jgi:hypothetical protein